MQTNQTQIYTKLPCYIIEQSRVANGTTVFISYQATTGSTEEQSIPKSKQAKSRGGERKGYQ